MVCPFLVLFDADLLTFLTFYDRFFRFFDLYLFIYFLLFYLVAWVAKLLGVDPGVTPRPREHA